jgi:hypothetical protein
MRVWLREDQPHTRRWSVPVALDDDLGPGDRCRPCATEPDTAVTATVVVSVRGKTYRDANGDQHWDWIDHDMPAVFAVTGRSETDDASGQTVVTAEATIGWVSDLPAVTETAVVVVDGVRWPVVESKPLVGAVWVRLERVDDAG